MAVEPRAASAREAPDFVAPYEECDLVMKGGITSGVVYPRAVIELARRRYRFRSIGGTSAGAIAAAATAAAEYGRQKEIARLKEQHGDDPKTYREEWLNQQSGFYELDGVVSDLTRPGFLANLFQPSPETRPLFNVFLEHMITMAHRKRQRALRENEIKLDALEGSPDMNELDARRIHQGFRELEREVEAERKAVADEGERLRQRLRQGGGRPGVLIRLLLWPLGWLRGDWVDHARDVVPLLYLHNRQWARGGNWRGLLLGALVGTALALLLVGLALLLVWLPGVVSPVPPTVAPATVAGALAPLMLAGMLGGGFLGWQFGAPVSVVRQALTQVQRGLRGNLYGMCTGQSVPSHHEQPVIDENCTIPGLTDWLADKIDRAAGIDVGASVRRPLTFGELRRPTAFQVERPARHAGEPFIELKMVTTDLSRRQPYVLPTLAANREFYFDEEDMRRLFPEHIVRHLIDHANREGQTRERFVVTEDGSGDWYIQVEVGGKTRKLRRLPDEDDLPVVVGMRMSLSFPLLLSAVPLYTIRRQARIEQRERAARLRWDGGRDERLEIRPDHVEQHWFSDGGICSNFPIHFFDKWFPDSPTFGINLDEPPAAATDGGIRPDSKAAKVTRWRRKVAPTDAGMPPDPRAMEAAERRYEHILRAKQEDLEQMRRLGLDKEVVDLEEAYWEHIHLPKPNKPGYPRWHPIGSLWPFLWSILDTSLNYRDTLQSNLPSYRERIVTVDLTRDEGGLNLNMDHKAIETITSKGKLAGYRLLRTFNLEHHQWTRLRFLAREVSKQLDVLYHDFGLAGAAAALQGFEHELAAVLKKLDADQKLVEALKALQPLGEQPLTEWYARLETTPAFVAANPVQRLLIREALARRYAQESSAAGLSPADVRYPYPGDDTPWRNDWIFNADDSLRLNVLLAMIHIWGSRHTTQLFGDGAPDRGSVQMRITPDL